MPAVLSKHLARVPFEDFYSSRGQVSFVVSVPVAMLQRVVLANRMTRPGLTWLSYSAKEGIREPELAQGLLDLVNPLSWEAQTILLLKVTIELLRHIGY